MRAASRRRARLLSSALVLAAFAGCRCDTFRFYDVTRQRVEECDILPQGELCDEPEGFAPPVAEVWAVERADDEIRVYVDQEVWVANPQDPEADADFITADKLEVDTREPGPCTSTTTRSFEILATFDTLTGEIAERTRIDGAEECGETPTGLRTRSRVDGILSGAP